MKKRTVGWPNYKITGYYQGLKIILTYLRVKKQTAISQSHTFNHHFTIHIQPCLLHYTIFVVKVKSVLLFCPYCGMILWTIRFI